MKKQFFEPLSFTISSPCSLIEVNSRPSAINLGFYGQMLFHLLPNIILRLEVRVKMPADAS
jgi:hypothetical protein